MEPETKTLAEMNENLNKFIADSQKVHQEFEKGYIHRDTFENEKKALATRLEQVELKLQRPPAIPEPKTEQEALHRKVFGKFLRKGLGALEPEEQKVLTIADSTHAGILASPEYGNMIIKGFTAMHPLRQLAKIRQTSAYAVEEYTETALPVATWVAESAEKTETTGLTYGLTELKTFEMKILLKATQKMLEDSSFNLEQEIADVSGRKMGVLEGTAFYSGNGTTAPEGIITNATVLADAKSVITDNTLAFDDFIATQYLLASPYARNAAWLNRSSLGVVVGLKSATTNTYLLQPNLQAGQPSNILGSPVYEWTDIPALTAATGITDAAMIAAYGDFRAGYEIVDRVDIVIQRLIEKYAEFGMIGFLVRKRVGGGVILPEAIQLLKNQTS